MGPGPEPEPEPGPEPGPDPNSSTIFSHVPENLLLLLILHLYPQRTIPTLHYHLSLFTPIL